jgi:hypothetical protein
MKWLYLLLGQTASAYNCVSHNTSYTSLDIYSNNWIHDLMVQKESVSLEFNPPKGTTMKDWVVKNGWAFEEWAKDGKEHFKTFHDKELCKNVLRIDVHRDDGDGSNQKNFNQGSHRVRQEIKIHDPSPDEWKIHFDDYIYFDLLLKFDDKFKYDLTHFYHIFQLKPVNDLSHMPVFTISTIKHDVYISFNTVEKFSDKRPSFTLYKVIERSKIIGKWLRLELFFHPVKNGETEILFTLRDLCNKTLHHNYITGKIYQDDISPYIRPKIGQYHKYSQDIPYENSIYYANVTMKKLRFNETKSKSPPTRRQGIFGQMLDKCPTIIKVIPKTVTKFVPKTTTIIRPIVTTITETETTTTSMTTTKTVMHTNSNTKPTSTSTPHHPTHHHPTHKPTTSTHKTTSTIKPTTTTSKPTTPTTGSNAIVNAINRVFGLNLGENTAQHSCAARHAASEPTIQYAHMVWRTGDNCQGGIGAVWSGSPDPDMAARMWLNSPPHASIIRGATRLACGSGPSSAVCIAYR